MLIQNYIVYKPAFIQNKIYHRPNKNLCRHPISYTGIISSRVRNKIYNVFAIITSMNECACACVCKNEKNIMRSGRRVFTLGPIFSMPSKQNIIG
jgi:hypothetical protein